MMVLHMTIHPDGEIQCHVPGTRSWCKNKLECTKVGLTILSEVGYDDEEEIP